jgi:hypothetical protein
VLGVKQLEDLFAESDQWWRGDNDLVDRVAVLRRLSETNHMELARLNVVFPCDFVYIIDGHVGCG